MIDDIREGFQQHWTNLEGIYIQTFVQGAAKHFAKLYTTF